MKKSTRKPIRERIAERAYQKFLERGAEHGRDVEDWLAAEAEILGTKTMRLAAAAAATAALPPTRLG